MKMRSSWLANTIWQVTALPAWLRFQRVVKNVAANQARLLSHYLAENQYTAYGQRYSFGKLTDISDYQHHVPLTDYDDYAPEIEEIGAGVPNILTTSPVRIFEPSSGSTAPSKWIPYTHQLQREFQFGIHAWIYALFNQIPELKAGPAYWSISPLTTEPTYTSGGIPIGFEEDSAYLGTFGNLLVQSMLAVPNEVKQIRDIDNFRYVTLLFLLQSAKLRLISIWNPTFFMLLLTKLSDWWTQLLDDVKTGSLNPPQPMDTSLRWVLSQKILANPRRAAQLSQINPRDYVQMWSDLKLISCWMDGPAKPFAAALMQLFPGVVFQPKGLIATEAFVSFPVKDLPGTVLAVHAHFFEFLPIDPENGAADTQNPRLAHELEDGRKYSVVLTTGGGFYRYLLQDLIEVVGKYHQAPLIRFVSKLNRISDWFGEKLSEGFVSSALDAVFQDLNLQPIFAMLAPNNSGAHFRYTLYLEIPPEQLGSLEADRIGGLLDQQLNRNFHYEYCRKLGQIAPIDVVLIAQEGHLAYLETKRGRGLKLGDIKHTALETDSGWDQVFHSQTPLNR